MNTETPKRGRPAHASDKKKSGKDYYEASKINRFLYCDVCNCAYSKYNMSHNGSLKHKYNALNTVKDDSTF
jgi:hypothetical protein